MKSRLLFTFILANAVFFSAYAQMQSLPLKGLNADHEGVFAWNEYTNHTGHPIPAPYNGFGNDTAYYFIATRDIGSFDMAATTGMHGSGTLVDFPKLAAALAANSKSLSSINVRFATTDLGPDVLTSDWNLVGSKETRTYTGGSYAILLDNDTLIVGAMPEIYMSIQYNSSMTPMDDSIYAITDWSLPTLYSTGGAVTDSIANALLLDIGVGLRFNFQSMEPAGQNEYRAGNIFGAFFEIQQAYIEAASLGTGTQEIANVSNVVIYPSPAHDNLQIQFDKITSVDKISIVNILGEMVASASITQGTSLRNTSVSVSNLNAGVYFCVIQDASGKLSTQKFVKE